MFSTLLSRMETGSNTADAVPLSMSIVFIIRFLAPVRVFRSYVVLLDTIPNV